VQVGFGRQSEMIAFFVFYIKKSIDELQAMNLPFVRASANLYSLQYNISEIHINLTENLKIFFALRQGQVDQGF
jgi:hypothetical protein